MYWHLLPFTETLASRRQDTSERGDRSHISFVLNNNGLDISHGYREINELCPVYYIIRCPIGLFICLPGGKKEKYQANAVVALMISN
jgi:hypothetical protein